jgi:hypothetical protein
VTFEGVDRAKNDDNPSDHDPSSFDQSKDDQDRDKDRDRERKGDTEDSDSSGEFKMTTEQKAMWKELKYQISGKGGTTKDLLHNTRECLLGKKGDKSLEMEWLSFILM